MLILVSHVGTKADYSGVLQTSSFQKMYGITSVIGTFKNKNSKIIQLVDKRTS